MLQTNQRLGRQNLPGSHVDLGQVVKHQRASVDDVLEMKLDVVAKFTIQRHVVGERRDLVSAGTLGGQHGLIGTTQQVEVSRPGTPNATPMLAVRVSSSPSMATRSRSFD